MLATSAKAREEKVQVNHNVFIVVGIVQLGPPLHTMTGVYYRSLVLYSRRGLKRLL